MNHLEQITLTDEINNILKKHGIQEVISPHDITITENIVSDFVKQDSRLSSVIINFLWASVKSAEVYHYTSRDKAENILKEGGTFRLTNIAKRYKEHEIVTFCQTHNLQGYLEKDEKGEPKYKNLIMPNTFYASFTDTNLSLEKEDYFWRSFAACDGVRLKIKITASNPNFRKVYYEKTKGEEIPLLKELTTHIREQYKREFILTGISRLCACYLPDYPPQKTEYGIEEEYRMLYRVWEGSKVQVKNDRECSYIELPLNTMCEYGYQLDIIEVHARECPKMQSKYLFSQRA